MDFEKEAAALIEVVSQTNASYPPVSEWLRQFAAKVIADYERTRWEASYKALLEVKERELGKGGENG